jgi:hypothetical protein
MRTVRIAFIAAAVWSVAASVYVLLSPLTVHEVRASRSANGSFIPEEITRQASWYEMQGLWGVIVIAIFASLFILIALLALKERYLPLLAISLLATILVFLTGFSVGPFYLPAVAALLLGWFGVGIHKLLSSGRSASA